jgi:hypothetical protein
MLAVFSNIARWAGQFLSPATNTAPAGSEYAPVIRPILRKGAAVLYTGPLAASQVYTTQWFDTTQTGDAFVQTCSYANQIGVTLIIQGTDDPANANMAITIGNLLNANGTQTPVANAVNPVSANIFTRYWRIQYTNGATAASTFELTYTTQPVFNAGLFTNYNTNAGKNPTTVQTPGSNLLNSLVTIGSTSNSTGIGDAAVSATCLGMMQSGTGTAIPSITGTMGLLYNGASWDRQRTPTTFRGSQFNAAGQNLIWQPQTGKKAHLMKYKIEAGEDCTITSGPLPVNVSFWYGIGTANNLLTSVPFAYTHRFVVPSSVLTTSFNGYDSGWIDLGNGNLAANASVPLYAGLMVPQSTSAVNPSWTIASNQWEAITVGFKTTGALGMFKLIQTISNNSTASPTTLANSAISVTQGNTIVVLIRTTNIAAGAPTFSAADTAGNSYTATAVTTNTSDGANGSSLCVLYASNITGNASNVVTVTISTHTPTTATMVVLEYGGMSTGIDAALVGTTGNSTTPASGNYTPSTAGDLIISAFSTSVLLTAPIATIGSNFRIVWNGFVTTAGSISVADNWGNGSLLAGQINVVACGTEE